MRRVFETGIQQPVQRLNLIFHGLMAFLDVSDQYYDVLIPKAPNHHEAWYGNPRTCEDSDYFGHCLHEFETGFGPGPAMYHIEGVYPSAVSDIGKPAKANALILAKSKLDVKCDHVRNVIRVPKPNIIRHYRGGETFGVKLAEDDDTKTLFTPPAVIHEITVFSYFCFNSPRLVDPEGHRHKIHMFSGAQGGKFWNLGIYSQPKKPCHQNDSKLFNDMFCHKGTTKPPTVNLALVESFDDGPPKWTGSTVGIAPIELKTLCELSGYCKEPSPSPEPGQSLVHELSEIPGGCGNGFVCEDGNSA